MNPLEIHRLNDRRLSISFDICHLTGNTPTDGNSSVITNLATNLHGVGKTRNIDVILYALKEGVLDQVPESEISHVLGSNLSIPAHRLVRYGLPMNLLKDRPNVFLNIASCYQPTYVPSKFVSIVHDIAFELDEWRSYYTDELREFLSVNTRSAVRRSSGLVAVSNRTREDLINVYGVSPEKVSVIHNGFDKKNFNAVPTPADLEIRRKLGDYPYFLSVGTLQPRKNYSRLIDAFVKLKRKCKIPHKLIIVGERGWLSDQIIEIAQANRSHDVVIWGRANQNELPALYRNAFAMVFPALYEGFGIPAVEAMACGIPVLGSETGSLGEIIGSFGLQFSPYSVDSIANSMELLLNDGSLVAELKRKSIERAEHFGWEISANEYIDYCLSIARG